MDKRLPIRNLCHSALFAALIAACAQVAIPLPGNVPFTLQTWAVALAGVVLGSKKGMVAVAVYVLLGAAGVPVFAGFKGGIGVVIGPTGGFLLAFPVLAILAGWGEARKSIGWLIAGLASGITAVLMVGMAYYSFVMATSLSVAFSVAVLPFIPSEVLMIGLVSVIGRSLKSALTKAGIKI